MKIIERPDLAEYSSIHIGGLGNFLYLPETEAELLVSLRQAAPAQVIGGGTNIIFADGFKRNVLSLSHLAQRDISLSASKVVAGAGVKLSRLVYAGCRAGLSGVEVLAGIPGTLGGAVVMNAGSRYGCIGDFVQQVRVYARSRDAVVLLPKEELKYAYRYSVLQDESEYIVLGVELEFPDQESAAVLTTRASSIIRERLTSRIRYPNCGSIFKNPAHELTAGAMIDRLGLKGFSVGGIAVAQEHGNIIINRGSGSYAEFVQLLDILRERVYTEYKVELGLEVRVLGGD